MGLQISPNSYLRNLEGFGSKTLQTSEIDVRRDLEAHPFGSGMESQRTLAAAAAAAALAAAAAAAAAALARRRRQGRRWRGGGGGGVL